MIRISIHISQGHVDSSITNIHFTDITFLDTIHRQRGFLSLAGGGGCSISAWPYLVSFCIRNGPVCVHLSVAAIRCWILFKYTILEGGVIAWCHALERAVPLKHWIGQHYWKVRWNLSKQRPPVAGDVFFWLIFSYLVLIFFECMKMQFHVWANPPKIKGCLFADMKLLCYRPDLQWWHTNIQLGITVEVKRCFV